MLSYYDTNFKGGSAHEPGVLPQGKVHGLFGLSFRLFGVTPL